MKRISAVMGAAALVAAQFAEAGMTTPIAVTVGPGYAFGTLAAARHSNDKTQYIGCYAQTSSYAQIVCSATDSKGHGISCYLSNPSLYMYQTVIGINESSLVQFGTGSTGGCTYIIINNGSQYVH